MSVDPPRGGCPPWCENPPATIGTTYGPTGPCGSHTWTRTTATYQTIRVEFEQHTPTGPQRRRDVVLDVEAPTQWDITTAEEALTLLAHASTAARPNFGVGQQI